MWTLSWQQTAPFGGPAVCFSAAFAIGDRAYVGTGYGPTREFWQYDPETDGWTRKADFGGTARGAATAFSIGDKGYVGFGYDGAGQRSDLWEYDPLSDHWTQRASLPGAARDHAVAFTIGQRAYVVSGTSGEGAGTVYLREVWEYDPAGNQWTQRASIPEAAAASAAFVLGGKGYVATGVVSQSPSPVLTKKLWQYDPLTDSWTAKAEFPGLARFRAAAFTLDGRGVLGTGIESVEESSVVVFQDLWQYDPQGDAWTRLPGFPGGARGAAVSFVLGSRGYVGTGMDAYRQNLRDFWSCEPAVTAVTPSGDDIHSPVRVVPNPFVSETTLSFRVDTCQDLGVDLFSANGCLIRRLRVEQSGGGMANAVWDGKTSEGLDAFSGVYLYRIRGGGKIAQGKLLLMRE